VPAEDFSQWEALADALGSAPGFKFTLALTPAMLNDGVRDVLDQPLRTGRLELAMRIPGDPILPLVAADSSPGGLHDVLARLALAREKFRSVLSTAPAGFVPGGGTPVAGLESALPALGVSWAAVGKGPPSRNGGFWLAFTPLKSEDRPPVFQEFEAAARPDPSLPAGPAAIVLDEAAGLVPRGSLAALIKELADKGSAWRWQTASEYGAPGSSASEGLDSPPLAGDGRAQDWPGWAPTTLDAPAARSAGKAYGTAAAALRRYQNSGTADLKALEHAAEALYAAGNGRYYRVLSGATAGDTAAADRELRRHLMNVYRRIKQTVPGSFYASFAGEQSSAETASLPDEVSTDVHAERGASWLSLRNPAGSTSRGPNQDAAAEPWRILDLRLDWDSAAVTFTFRMAALDVSSAAPAASEVPQGPTGRLVLDVYMDINHVAGAGSLALLEGRDAFAMNRDAWEYALSVGPSGGVLLRALPGSSPAVLSRIPVTVDPARRSLRAVVPRRLLRGNPLRWGYIVAAFSARSSAPEQEPPVAVVAGGPLGRLAPVEQQRSSARRLGAVRLP
jgi:hypothetical protein